MSGELRTFRLNSEYADTGGPREIEGILDSRNGTMYGAYSLHSGVCLDKKKWTMVPLPTPLPTIVGSVVILTDPDTGKVGTFVRVWGKSEYWFSANYATYLHNKDLWEKEERGHALEVLFDAACNGEES